MQKNKDFAVYNKNKVAENPFWNLGEQKELLLHRIHAYPAKFPPFLVQKLIEYFDNNGKNVNLVADPFCGCGTSALESVRLNKNFWGCDINPVATLIAKTKSKEYQSEYLNLLYTDIYEKAARSTVKVPKSYSENERLKYWFEADTIDNLYRILQSIEKLTSPGKYRDFFLTGFSNILKPCSRWLTKSIKPQIDPNKNIAIPLSAFDRQIKMMINAAKESQASLEFTSQVKIVNKNIFDVQVESGFADLVVTSPPYVTSYEYADLHQLSTIWLGYTSDYRSFRDGTLGSSHYSGEIENMYKSVNQIAQSIYDKLRKLDNSKARSVLRYFYDLDLAVEKIRQILKSNGAVAFVIGNTRYRGVPVDNAKYLAQSMLDREFKNVKITKRKISNKILTPYRNKIGQFISHGRGRKIYSYEYILIGEK